MATTVNNNGKIIRDARTRYRAGKREQEGAHGAYESEIRRSGGNPRVDVTVNRGAAPTDIAELMGTTEHVVIRKRKMYDGDRLIQLADTFIPVDVAEAAGIEQVDTGVGGIISRMAEAGFGQGDDADETVEQLPATTDQAAALGISEGESVLTITHVGKALDGRVVEVTRHSLSPGWQLKFSVPLT
jgi:DNA-binding GntR family transcriptional regulator